MGGSRRKLLGAGAAVGVALMVAGARGAEKELASGRPDLDPIPPAPANPVPGKPGEFDFLTGEWRIHHWQPKPGTSGRQWIEFDGEATVHGILDGMCSVEELRIPARNFSGMGLRLLDVERKVWSDHWVNAKSGVMTTPGVSGCFENGAGIFVSEDVIDGKPAKFAGVWDLITPTSCRWRQAVSRDGGKSWEQNWIMAWRRA
jgi:hypothetical protein